MSSETSESKAAPHTQSRKVDCSHISIKLALGKKEFGESTL